MRAVTYERYGGPEVLALSELPRPVPGNDEVLIRVEAVEAAKTDCEMRGFDFSVKWFVPPMRLAMGVFKPRQPVLGMYLAGVVEQVGAKVTDFEVGQAVFGSTGFRRGAYSEYVTVPNSALLVDKPASMTFAEAAAVPLGAINALHFMRRARITAGDSVLIVGAGGVIGAYAVQVATLFGGRVTAVDAGHKEAFVRSLGATEFVDYRSQSVTELETRFAVILDMIPSSPVAELVNMLVPGGRYVHGNPTLSIMARALLSRFSSEQIQVRFAEETRAVLRELAVMIDGGELGAIVDRVLPLSRAAEAHRLVESEERLGAIVLAAGERAQATG